VHRLFPALVLFLAAFSLSTAQQPPVSEWTGFVRDTANQTASGAVIELSAVDPKASPAHFSQTAGENGGFHFARLLRGHIA